jgi:hypothetical protein
MRPPALEAGGPLPLSGIVAGARWRFLARHCLPPAAPPLPPPAAAPLTTGASTLCPQQTRSASSSERAPFSPQSPTAASQTLLCLMPMTQNANSARSLALPPPHTGAQHQNGVHNARLPALLPQRGVRGQLLDGGCCRQPAQQPALGSDQLGVPWPPGAAAQAPGTTAPPPSTAKATPAPRPGDCCRHACCSCRLPGSWP